MKMKIARNPATMNRMATCTVRTTDLIPCIHIRLYRQLKTCRLNQKYLHGFMQLEVNER